LSTFGFLHGGTMNMNVTEFTFDKIGLGKETMVSKNQTYLFGILIKFLFFSLDLVLIKQRIVVLLIIW